MKDWVDKMIHQLVEPTSNYVVKLIENPQGRGAIDKNSAVLVVYVFESHIGPHMMDGSYPWADSEANPDCLLRLDGVGRAVSAI